MNLNSINIIQEIIMNQNLGILNEKHLRKRLVFFTIDYYPNNVGGIGVHLYKLIKNLSKDNEITVILVKYWPNITDETQIRYENGVKVITINGHYDEIQELYRYYDEEIELMTSIGTSYFITREIEKLVDFTQPNTILHNHSYLFNFTCEHIKRKYSVPLFTTIHYKLWESQCDIDGSLLHSMLSHSNNCIFVSDWIRNTLNVIDNSWENKHIVIHNGADKTTYSDTRSSFDGSVLKICFVGMLIHRKGLDRLFEAVNKAINKSNIEIYVIGEGPEKEKMITLARNLGINAGFLGKLPNTMVREWMHNSHLVVMPSREETFSIVALEALAEGRPVFASKLGGFLELIQDKKNGVLFDDLKDLSERIDEVFAKPYMLHEMSSEAYKTSKMYDWNVIGKKTETLYDESLLSLVY